MSRIVAIFLVFAVVIPLTNGLNPRRLDEGVPVEVPGGENKCGGCPCNNPCIPPSSPPPSPILPPPPPPSPPPPKKPPSVYCPPPPSGGGGGGGGGGGSGGYVPNPTNPQYIYTTGPPGNLYPVDQYFSGANLSFSNGFQLLIGGLIFFVLVSFW